MRRRQEDLGPGPWFWLMEREPRGGGGAGSLGPGLGIWGHVWIGEGPNSPDSPAGSWGRGEDGVGLWARRKA